MRAQKSSLRATTISAAAEGVGARRSATKSAMVTSLSCPTAEIVGTDEHGKEDGLGAVRLAADPDNKRAEYAVTVRSDLKGSGIGRLMMRTIIDYARQRGVGELFGLVLRENERMLKICRDMGFAVRGVPDDPTVVEVVLPLS